MEEKLLRYISTGNMNRVRSAYGILANHTRGPHNDLFMCL